MPVLRPDDVLRYLGARGFLSGAEVELVQARWALERDGPLLDFLAREKILPEEVAADMAELLGAGQLEGLEPALPGLVLLRQVGRGGRGSVYRAWQPSLRRVVAVKILSRALSGNREYVQRFIREAKVASKAAHRNIVRAFDINRRGADVYMVMEYVSGVSLGAILRQRTRLPVREGLEIGRAVGDALSYIARVGLVHRDIKPDNIMIDRGGRVKLCDLGLARPSGGAQFTSPLVAQGTPSYMAPETAMGREIDSQADVYGLGVTLYRTLLGKLPFDNPDAVEVLRMHVEENPRGLDNGDLPGALNELIRRMLAKEPAQRPPAREMGREIRALQRALPDTENPRLYELVPGGEPAAEASYSGEDDLDEPEAGAFAEAAPAAAPQAWTEAAPHAPVARRGIMPGAGVGTLALALIAAIGYILFMTLGGMPEAPQDPRVPELEQKLKQLEEKLAAAESERTGQAALIQQAAQRLQLEQAHDARNATNAPPRDSVEDVLPEIEAMRKMQAVNDD